MSRETPSTDFSLLAGSVIALCVALLLWLAVPLTWAANPADPNPHTRAYIQGLGHQERAELQQSLRENLIRKSSREDLDIIPAHLVYHSIFLDMLMQPALRAALPQQDRQLIDSLPAHDHRKFATGTRNAMTAACTVIDRLSQHSPAAAYQAVQAFKRAQRQVSERLDKHYQQVLNELTETGRNLVVEEAEKLRNSDLLVHAEIDLETLSFARPEFTLAFLQDACDNSSQLLANGNWTSRTLGDQLADDYDRGAVQIFQPR